MPADILPVLDQLVLDLHPQVDALVAGLRQVPRLSVFLDTLLRFSYVKQRRVQDGKETGSEWGAGWFASEGQALGGIALAAR